MEAPIRTMLPRYKCCVHCMETCDPPDDHMHPCNDKDCKQGKERKSP